MLLPAPPETQITATSMAFQAASSPTRGINGNRECRKLLPAPPGGSMATGSAGSCFQPRQGGSMATGSAGSCFQPIAARGDQWQQGVPEAASSPARGDQWQQGVPEAASSPARGDTNSLNLSPGKFTALPCGTAPTGLLLLCHVKNRQGTPGA